MNGLVFPTHSHFTEFCKSGDMETHSSHPIKSESTMYNFLCIHSTDLIPTCDGWFLVYQIKISNTVLVSVLVSFFVYLLVSLSICGLGIFDLHT